MKRDGLAAVVRVRSVRERDSRIGLAHALSDQRAAQVEAARIATALTTPTMPVLCSGAEFLAGRQILTGGAVVLSERQREAEVAAGVSTSARARWQDDRSALRAVELLVERRAENRRIELARREAAVSDEIATQRWARAGGAR